jgi:hypothetical protein
MHAFHKGGRAPECFPTGIESADNLGPALSSTMVDGGDEGVFEVVRQANAKL